AWPTYSASVRARAAAASPLSAPTWGTRSEPAVSDGSCSGALAGTGSAAAGLVRRSRLRRSLLAILNYSRSRSALPLKGGFRHSTLFGTPWARGIAWAWPATSPAGTAGARRGTVAGCGPLGRSVAEQQQPLARLIDLFRAELSKTGQPPATVIEPVEVTGRADDFAGNGN